MRRLILIFIVISTLNVYANQKKADIIKLLQEYTELNRQFSEAFDKKQYDQQKKLGEKIELLHEERLLPSLTLIEESFCKNKDQELLNAYLAMLEVIGHSASEAPRWTFAVMYTCHPDLILNAISKSNNKKQVVADLSFGFENVIYTIDTTHLDIESLRLKMENIK